MGEWSQKPAVKAQQLVADGGNETHCMAVVPLPVRQQLKSLPANINTDPLPGIRRTGENIAAKKRVSVSVKECLSPLDGGGTHVQCSACAQSPEA